MLLRKAKRTLLANKKSYFACMFLIAVGIIMQTALGIAASGLEKSMLEFYKSNNLADTYATVQSMPEDYVDTLEKIPGISSAEGRYIAEMRAEIPNSDETITLRLIAANSIENPTLNALNITGTAPKNKTEILVNPAFFKANNLSEGDTISIFSKGKEYTFTLTGTAISPEYVYITKDMTQMLPDEAGFGIGYITTESMEALTGYVGVANSIIFQREKDVSFDDIKLQLEDSLSRFGLKELFDKEDLLSCFFLDLEITSIRSMSSSMPTVFLLLAAVVLYLMLKRVIDQERTQIGTLKAFGYSNIQLILHYLTYGAITGTIGGITGCILGYMLSGPYLEMFQQFFMLPPIESSFDLNIIIKALSLAIFSGLLGAYAGARKMIRLAPAEAMRPESPKPIRFDIIKYLGVLKHFLNSRGNMSVRGITRNPIRSTFVVISIMFSFGIISIVGSFNGLIDKMIFSQLQDIQRYQVKLSLSQPLSYEYAVEDAYRIENITYAEGILELPFKISNRHLVENAMVTGITKDSQLYHIVDTNTKRTFIPPADSFILTNGLADQLQVKAGDYVTLSSPLLEKDISVFVSKVIEQNMGSGCYTQLDYLSSIINHQNIATSVILNTNDLRELKETIKGSNIVTTIEDKENTLKGYQKMMGMFSSLYVALQVLGTLVAFAIIYNTTTISLSERKREYATLRVIGLSVGEVSEIMNFEYAILTSFGILLGIPFTKLLNSLMNLMVDSDIYSMPSTLPLSAYLIGASCCFTAIFLSARSARKRIQTFDMVEVLKERD